MTYSVSKRASTDLENIWLYTFENWSLEQADRYLKLILDEFNYLSKDPNSGKGRNDIRDGYRSSKVKSHLTHLSEGYAFVSAMFFIGWAYFGILV